MSGEPARSRGRRAAVAKRHALTNVRLIMEYPASPKTLDERYDYIRRESVPLAERWPNPPSALQPLLQRLEQLGVLLLADHPKWDRISVKTQRLGSSVIVPGRQSIIWINFIRHNLPNTNTLIVPELIDTIFHEAIHTTGTLLGRFIIQPEDLAALDYIVEEVCALAGTSELHRNIGDFSAATSNKRAAQEQASKAKLPVPVRRVAIDKGNEAARFLLTSGAGPS